MSEKKEVFNFINSSGVTTEHVEASFLTAIEKLIEGALNRDNPKFTDIVDPNMPVIQGSLDDWMRFVKNHPRYPIAVRNLSKELKNLDSKRFDVIAKFSPERLRKQRFLVIASLAQMFVIAVLRQKEQSLWTDAHKAGLEKKQTEKKEIQSLIKEVNHGEEIKEEEAPIKSYVPSEIKTENTKACGTEFSSEG